MFCFSCLWGGGGGAALIASTVYHCSVVRQKEFSRKVEMNKIESFYWNELSNKSFSFESEQFLICVLFQLFSGVAMITFSIYHCCVVRQKEFSRKTQLFRALH